MKQESPPATVGSLTSWQYISCLVLCFKHNLRNIEHSKAVKNHLKNAKVMKINTIPATVAVINCNPLSYFGRKYNGQRFDIAEQLNPNHVALMLPDAHGKHTVKTDFTRGEVIIAS